VLRTAEGEQVNARLLLFLRFCFVSPFLSSVFWHGVFAWHLPVNSCHDVSHLFLGCAEVFFLCFEVVVLSFWCGL
jgi:hypothetical protein